MRLVLRPERLTREAFAPYGHVIEAEGSAAQSINEGTTARFHCLATVETDGGSAIISLFRAQPRPMPIAIRMLERHPLGSQAFMPLRPRDWLIVVAPPGDEPKTRDLRAYRATGSQGVNYRRGVWHHPLLVLDLNSDFLVVDREGAGENLDEYRFGDEIDIVLENQ